MDLVKKHGHFLNENAGYVNELCSPLFKAFDINYFSWEKLYFNGKYTSLVTEPNIYLQFTENKLPVTLLTTEGIGSIEAALNQDGLDVYRQNNIPFAFALAEASEDYMEYYILGSNKSQFEIIDLLCNQKELFWKFQLYFKNKARKLLVAADNVGLMYPEENIRQVEYPITEGRHQQFMSEIAMKRVILNFNSLKITLSGREYQCLELLDKGMSAKAIGRILNISPRTVEEYIAIVKNKFGFDNKAQLIGILQEVR